MNMDVAFKVAGILVSIHRRYIRCLCQCDFPSKRRSREIGLYQLIGLTKGAVTRLLIIENALLGVGALIIGIGAGMLYPCVFIDPDEIGRIYEGFVELSFSMAAVIQTA